MMLFVVITGALVFLTAYLSGIPLMMWVFSKPLGIIAITLATLALGLIFYCIWEKKLIPVRVLAGFQIIMILVAATYQHNPNIILLGNGNHISLLEYAAPQKKLFEALGWALMLGCVFILPFLFLLNVFFQQNEEIKNKFLNNKKNPQLP